MTGARREEALELELDNTWTCACGHVNKMNSFQINMGGDGPCSKPGCKTITQL